LKNSSQNSQLALECETQDICSLLPLIQVQVSYATTSGDLDIWPLYSPHSFVEICPNMCPKELFQIRYFSSAFVTCTDYGRPMKPFFIKIPNFGLGQISWADRFWGIFGRFISTHFGTVSPLSMFSINQPLFLQKTKPFYIQIPNIYLGLGFEFEFGSQRIRDLAIVCTYFVVTRIFFRSFFSY
jgi:hypothetical protein